MKLYYDLHLHSCLSPCGDNDMTPYNLVHMAALQGMQMIALTDHNSCLNCPAAMEVGMQTGLLVIPGMELCTAEEAHVVCLFPALEPAMFFSEFIKTHIPPVQNRTEIFGEQRVMNAEDGILGMESTLLTTASEIRVDRVAPLVREYGGVCFPAHLDRPSYSVISSLGTFEAAWGFHADSPLERELTGVREEVGDHLGQAILLGIDNAILFRYLAIESDTVFHPALEGLV